MLLVAIFFYTEVLSKMQLNLTLTPGIFNNAFDLIGIKV